MQEVFIKLYGMLKAGIVLFNSKNAEGHRVFSVVARMGISKPTLYQKIKNPLSKSKMFANISQGIICQNL